MKIQTRNEAGKIDFWETLEYAFNQAAFDKSIWKISFPVGDEHVRLIRTDQGWLYENVYGNRNI